jgi:hypothetical protein
MTSTEITPPSVSLCAGMDLSFLLLAKFHIRTTPSAPLESDELMSAFKLTQTPKYPHYFREMKWY